MGFGSKICTKYDYVEIKDKYIYFKYREENPEFKIPPEPVLSCEHCTFYSMVKDIDANTKLRSNKYYNRENKKNCGDQFQPLIS